MSEISPESTASWLRRLYFSWAFPMLRQGKLHPLTVEALLPLRPEEKPRTTDTEFERLYDSMQHARRPILAAIWALERKSLLWAFCISMIHLANLVGNPLILRELLQWLEQPSDGGPWYGYGLAAGLVVLSLSGSLAIHHMFQVVLRMMVRVRVPLVMKIYRKSLRLTQEARQATSSGQIINLMGTDVQKFINAINLVFSLWFHPMQLALSIFALYIVLGPPSLVGVGVLVLTFALSLIISRRQILRREKLMTHTDARVALMNEILMSIRMIKFYSWEKSFEREVQSIRAKELHQLAALARLSSAGTLIFLSTPVVVAFATFATMVVSGRELNVADVFSALAFFTLLRHAMLMLPDVAAAAIEANVGLRRVEDFLRLPEIPEPSRDAFAPGQVHVRKASWDWKTDVRAVSEVDLQLERGDFVCVVGEIGSGKSALLQGLIGEIPCVAGQSALGGKVAYVPQQAWIQNDTIRNNILFGMPFDAARYERIVRACCLDADLSELPDGDRTEIGERGVNLSGGQKQRVSLARAAYADADLYLLDDPLSALDPKVAATVYHNLVRVLLSQRTRILVTHRLEFVDDASEVLVFSEGKIVERGTAKELRLRSGRFSQLWNVHSERVRAEVPAEEGEPMPLALMHAESDLPLDSSDDTIAEELTAGPTRQLMVTEERFTGSVSADVYRGYLSVFAPQAIFALLLLIFLLREGLSFGSDGWLAWWTTAAALDPTLFIAGFAALGLSGCVAIYIRSLIISLRGLKAGQEIHDRLLRSVLRAPMTFFEENPVGRILNRFSRDLEAVDLVIPRTLHEVAGCACTIVATIVLIAVVGPWTLIGIVPIVYLYVLAQGYYRPASREAQRLDSITRSPIFAQFSESLVGTSVIRAFSAMQRFEQQLLSSLETNCRTFYTMVAANRWLGVRIETLGACVVGCAAFGAVAFHQHGHLGFTGLAITYALAITGAMNWAIRMFSQLESNMSSVERVNFYSDLSPERWQGIEVAADWPQRGAIELHDLELRYRPELPAVITNLSAKISAGEKIGIVGRTGSGKSSLLLGLYRIIEPSAGKVFIDGVDTSSLSLEQLREALAIIPQDPTLFRGTIRKNLDPFEKHSDEELWEVLTRAHVDAVVRSFPKGLDAPVSEAGGNLSVGQRQLLCLARALLRKNKILLLDEATANVDVATDALVQWTIREAFADCTVLTIAHRLSTILDSDRIMLIDSGKLIEFDTPRRLAVSQSGLLRSLLKESGGVFAKAS